MFKQTIALAVLVVVAFSQEEVAARRPDRNADLIAVAQIHRHGQRVPVVFYKNDPNSDSSYWPAAGGQLTNTGKNQHLNLGQFTRRRYDGFLPREFDPDDIYIQTTDMDRTHMSVQSNLLGIYPPVGQQVWNRKVRWQPIPVRIVDEKILTPIPRCSIYQTELANVLANSDDFKKINEENAELYAYLSANSGGNVTSLSDVSGIYDPVHIEIQFGFEQPEWVGNIFPEPLTTLTGYYFWAHSYTDSMKRLSAGTWLYTVFNYFESMWADSTSDKKYQLYSAHDYNLAAILNTLGDYQKQIPGFASSIYFELRNKSGNAIVNIWYRDNGVFRPITISGCRVDCSLSDAQSLLSTWLLDASTWATECAASSTAFTDMEKVENDPQVKKEMKDVEKYTNAVLSKNKGVKGKKSVK